MGKRHSPWKVHHTSTLVISKECEMTRTQGEQTWWGGTFTHSRGGGMLGVRSKYLFTGGKCVDGGKMTKAELQHKKGEGGSFGGCPRKRKGNEIKRGLFTPHTHPNTR